LQVNNNHITLVKKSDRFRIRLEEFKKYYIAYKISKNFVDIYPQKSRLRLILNLSFDEVVDPNNLCKNITGWRMNGNVEVGFYSLEQLDDVMALVRQAFDKHSE